MQFTSTRVAASLALAFGILVSSTSHAARPEGMPADAQTVTPVWTPPGVMNKPMTVLVQLNGQSVAEQQGAAGRKLARAEKDSAKAQLRTQQDALRPNIEALGGTVLATFQSAINGIKVRIARSQVASLASLPGVVAVRPVQLHSPDNIHGVPLVGGPAVWGKNPGLHGEGVKIAIIDTGIDYTHANFGGSGDPADYAAEHAKETGPANPAWFGPSAPRVKGGTDLVGDAYDAAAPALDDKGNPNPKLVPHPDPNPLDCNGHGSHVAGTAAGSGVLSSGARYTGTYDANTISANNWNVGPGVAPKADIYSVRVFGCAGSTDVVVEALDWAVDNDMDVINMSLGAPFGTADTADAVASNNAAKAGIIVVASAGNSGANPYILGSPSSAEGAISVAANDPTQNFPGAVIGVGSGIQAINANGAPSLPSGGQIKVLRNSSGAISLGCDPNEYTAAGVTGKIVVTTRGTCARVARAIYGQKAGAAAVIMVNNANSFPPFEGQITSNPDTGEAYTVTIPFLGVPSSRGTALSNADGTSATLVANNITNPGYKAFASFTSGGPRTGDGGLKPDVTAPGVSISSTAVGTGTGSEILSGTSMAAPHTSGVAALTRQAHPGWRSEDLKSAIMHTADPALVVGYRTSVGGTGFVQAPGSTATQVVARTSGAKSGGALNFGVAEFRNPYSRSLDITLRNLGGTAAGFNVAAKNPQGSPHNVSLSSSAVSVPAGGEATVSVTLNVAPATAGSANVDGVLSYQEVAGLIEFAPQGTDNGGVTLRVPYLLVPRVESDVSTSLGRFSGGAAVATVTNKNGAIAGDADFYAWGLSAAKVNDKSSQTNDVRAVGAQSFPFPSTTNPDRHLVVFAVNTWDRWSSPSSNEFDIYVDVDGDGKDDYIIVGADQGAVQTGTFNGVLGSFVFSTRSDGASIAFLANAPTDGSTAELPVLSSQLCRTGEPCLNSAHPRLSYQIVSFDLLNGGQKAVPGKAMFNAWTNAISTGDFLTVVPGGSDSSVVIKKTPEFANTPPLGVMVITLDNQSGGDEAQLIPVK